MRRVRGDNGNSRGESFEEEFPTGQSQLIFATKVAKREGIAYSLEGGLCSELEETSGEEGTYAGELLDSVVGGNLKIA